MSEDIVWEEPPLRPGRGHPGGWMQVLALLRRNPGRWARIADDAWASVASQIKAGKVVGAEPGEFEAVFRSHEWSRRKGSIYARYVGTNGEHKDR